MEDRWCGDTDALLNRIGQLVLTGTFFLSFFLSFSPIFYFNQPIVKEIKNMGSPFFANENRKVCVRWLDCPIRSLAFRQVKENHLFS